MLSIQDILRYNKQMMLPEIGESGQKKIKNAKVLMIGAGGLGCPILQYLATAGVGTIGIIDFDKVELPNLHRQILYTENHIGSSKVVTAKKVLAELNPHIKIIPFDEKLAQNNCESIFESFDLIIDGSDNFDTRYLVNDTCVKMNKPLIYGSILKFEGQVAVFNHKGNKNLRDLFPELPSPEDVPNCSMNGVMGTLPGIIGVIMANEALKLIMEIPVLNDEILIFNTLDWNLIKLKY
ncbi:HesA/MoeB/ThiF family protein [Flavobacterium cucumis]|uniref:Molybdopterin-synthase adenylyltransferase n=1 Tax=Flavobacterium cucumis TaxID=416016 RepID=A0A1M7ZTD4_9FLAO|nr:HesA/MoeB/ThiF family protein [Flavobacterium cucumis]SHO72136.1 adenylyltransferase and sulfurtransferase [Flavobacterium cucumis]